MNRREDFLIRKNIRKVASYVGVNSPEVMFDNVIDFYRCLCSRIESVYEVNGLASSENFEDVLRSTHIASLRGKIIYLFFVGEERIECIRPIESEVTLEEVSRAASINGFYDDVVVIDEKGFSYCLLRNEYDYSLYCR